MTSLKSLLLVGAVTTSSFPVVTATADFTNSFDGITAGSDITLTWAESLSQSLCVTAQVIDRGEDGTKANAYKVNVTTTATGTSYTWSGVPYPLRRVKNGLYQVEVRDCSSSSSSTSSPTGAAAAPLVRSPFFAVEEEEDGQQVNSGPVPSSTAAVEEEKKKSGPPAVSKTALGVGLGVAIGVPSIIGLAVVGWCFRKKRRQRVAEERWRNRRRDFVIY